MQLLEPRVMARRIQKGDEGYAAGRHSEGGRFGHNASSDARLGSVTDRAAMQDLAGIAKQSSYYVSTKL